MTDTNSARSVFIEKIKNVIASLKQGGSKGNSVSASDIQELKALAGKYPNDPSIKDLIKELKDAEREALERISKGTGEQKHDVEVYTEEQRKDLLIKENDYFERSKERHELLDKLMSLEHSIESLGVREITQLYQDTVLDKEQRRASTELISHDLSSFSQTSKLDEEEKRREREAKDRLHRVLKEELFTAIVSNHVEIHAKETGRRTEDVTLDEVILARGDKVLKEFREAIPTVIEAFRASNEKLAALMFHNPEAIREHSGNVKQLHREAEKAHQKQKEYEQNKAQETGYSKSERDIEKGKDAGREKQSEAERKIAERKAKNAAAGSILPPPKSLDSSAVVDSSGIAAPKASRDVKSPAQSVNKDRLK